MIVKDKDIFIIFSKSRKEEHAVADFVARMLIRAGYSVYLYEDWDWSKRTVHKSYSYTEGEEYDPVRDALGEPSLLNRRRREEVDQRILERMLSRVRLVIFVHPIKRGMRSDGVQRELATINRILGMRSRSGNIIPRYMECSWNNDEIQFYKKGENVVLDPFSLPVSDSPMVIARLMKVLIKASLLLLSVADDVDSKRDRFTKTRWMIKDEVDKVKAVIHIVREKIPIGTFPDIDSDIAELDSSLVLSLLASDKRR